MRRPTRTHEWAALALITAGAAALRLIGLAHVAPDPFYDAAVRSMTLSWHNFFFGAFEPGASVSIDKPPVDLWLQVASVKLFGFTSTTLKLPEALAGVAAVPLLFAAVRRMWSTTAGLAAALALAVLPIEVITSRSDTMDGVMMALLVLALLLIVRACQSQKLSWLLAGAAVLGLAFDVKLLESIVALPGLAILAYAGLPGPRRRRVLALLGAGAVYVVVALSWLTATLLVPAHDRPWAIGSTNGSAWNAAFVFNGTERLSGKSPEPLSLYEPGRHYPEATQAERDRIPIVPPSATRLLARIGPLSGERLGLELLVALLLGTGALLSGLRRPPPQAQRGGDDGGDDDDADGEQRMGRAAAAGLGVWLLAGVVLFSEMARLHPRYVAAFTPAVAALLGIGVAWAGSGATDRRSANARLLALSVALASTVYYAERLLYGATGVWWVVLLGALGAVACALLKRSDELRLDRRAPGERPQTGGRQSLLTAATITLTLLAVLAVPVSADVRAINDHVTDAGYVGALPSEEQRLVSAYLRAHQGKARYEVAAESATQIGSLIVQDARPIVILTSYGPRVYTSVAKLERLIAQGEVRYAFLNTGCGRHRRASNAACSAPARWVRAHGTDVSGQAGLGQRRVLWALPGVRP